MDKIALSLQDHFAEFNFVIDEDELVVVHKPCMDDWELEDYNLNEAINDCVNHLITCKAK